MIDDDRLEGQIEEQIRYAITRADAVIFVVDAAEGPAPLDAEVARLLRTAEKPVILAANKVDDVVHEPEAAQFARLGFGEPLCLSALHSRGREELLNRVIDLLDPQAAAPPAPPLMKLAIVGKRNAGKSTLVNALAGEPRMIVSETPGTTRDSVDVSFERDGRRFVAIDTAGVRKKRRMNDIEFYSYTRALGSIRRADVVLFLIDATVPVAEVDLKLARIILDEYKPVVIAINKWDLAEQRATAEQYAAYIAQVMPNLSYAPLVFTTASSGRNVDAAIEVALSLHEQSRRRMTTGQLNQALQSVLAVRGPSPKRGTRAVKVYYATQVAVAPPTIVCFCNDPALVSDNYRRFLENRLREILPFREVPMRLLFRPRRGRQPGENQEV